MGDSGYANAHSQSRGGAEYTHVNGLTQQMANEELRRTASRASHQQRPLAPPQPPQASRGPAPVTSQMPLQQYSNAELSNDADHSRRQKKEKSPVDWVAFFGGKPPTEIITIHDDDSPAPPEKAQRPPPATNASSSSQHVDKKRRVNGAGTGEVAAYSTTHTPYSYSNGSSTETLQATTAATSLASQASSGSKLADAQTGQKRKRTTRTSEQERKKQETELSGRQGYLAEYGEYIPPPKQYKKQKDVVVPAIHDVRLNVSRESGGGDG